MKHKTDHLLEVLSKQHVQEINTTAINSVQLALSSNIALDNENSSNINNTSIMCPVLSISASSQTEHIPMNKPESIRGKNTQIILFGQKSF